MGRHRALPVEARPRSRDVALRQRLGAQQVVGHHERVGVLDVLGVQETLQY